MKKIGLLICGLFMLVCSKEQNAAAQELRTPDIVLQDCRRSAGWDFDGLVNIENTVLNETNIDQISYFKSMVLDAKDTNTRFCERILALEHLGYVALTAFKEDNGDLRTIRPDAKAQIEAVEALSDAIYRISKKSLGEERNRDSLVMVGEAQLAEIVSHHDGNEIKARTDMVRLALTGMINGVAAPGSLIPDQMKKDVLARIDQMGTTEYKNISHPTDIYNRPGMISVVRKTQEAGEELYLRILHLK